MRKHLWVLAGIMIATASPALAQDSFRDRDQHFRSSPSQRHYRNNYKPPRVYYPRKDEDRQRVQPSRPPASVPAPEYGAPPPAIERIPKT
ncbi:hypothetical protein [Agaricicola taiwanensis]|nr:hypothetical protein [Agaricicola taiwanensis]